MTRLSPEREAEIRANPIKHAHPRVVCDLLAELDAVRAERDELAPSAFVEEDEWRERAIAAFEEGG